MAQQTKTLNGRTILQHSLAIMVLTGVLYVIRYHLLGSEFIGRSYAETTLLLGFVLIVAYMAGIISAHFGLPRITGYLFSGILFGPSILGFATHETVNQLKVIDGMAVALIALTAGGEIKLEELKHIRKPLAWIVSATMLLTFLGVASLVLIMSRWFPFLPGPGNIEQWTAVAILLGTIAMASSPTVVIAVISETKAKGEVSELILGTTVLKDMAVVILFAIALSIALIFNNPGSTF
ncbi:MAG TPA: cation:proton antiporter, partial [Balneolales bacterium]|nr:cation:proton antiporter [Balneolales bacterium]